MKKYVGNDFFKEYANFGEMKFNGKNLISFVRYDTDIEKDEYVSTLYLYDIMKQGEMEKLTSSGSVGIHAWLDEDNLLIAEIREESDKEESDKGIPLNVFYSMNIETKEYSELFRIYRNVSDICVIDEDEYLLLCNDSIADEAIRERSEGNWEKYVEISEEERDYLVADEVPFWTNSAGFMNSKRGRVYLYSHGNLKTLSSLTMDVQAIASYENEYGVFYGVQAGGVKKTVGKLYKIDYSTGVISAIDDSEDYIYTKAQPIDGEHLLVCRSDRKVHGEYQNEYIDIINLKTGEYTRNNKATDIHLYDNVLNDVTLYSGWLNKITVIGDGMYLIATLGESSKIIHWQSGCDDYRIVTPAEGKILDYIICDNKIFMFAMRGLGAPELYVLDLATGEETCLSSENNHIGENYIFSIPERCNFINSDGIEIEGWIMKPINCEDGVKYPTILFIHGGPESAYGAVMCHEMQLMCAEGFGVMFCNPRGSEGRGGDFMDIRTKWGTVDYEDLMEFVDIAVERNDWIDAEELGVTGGSYGGIMTNWIIGHTTRFKAAISDRGVSDLFCDYALSEIGYPCNTDTHGVTPWENPKLMWDQSAIKYAPAIKTPVLFIHGQDDYICPYEHSLILHGSIAYHGGISKVVVFKGETHELCRSGSPKHRIRRLDEMVSWFKEYLGNRA